MCVVCLWRRRRRRSGGVCGGGGVAEVEEKDGSCGGQLRRGGSPCKAVAPVRHAVLTRAPWERGEPGERRERGVEARSCVGGMRRRRTLTVTCDWRRARMWRRISIYRKKNQTSDHLARLTRTLSAASESVLSRSVFRTFADAAVGGPWVQHSSSEGLYCSCRRRHALARPELAIPAAAKLNFLALSPPTSTSASASVDHSRSGDALVECPSAACPGR